MADDGNNDRIIDFASAQDDEADFARLAPTTPSRRPIVSVAVIAVGIIALVRLADDTRYALAPRAPSDLGDARALATDALVENRHAALRGLPDWRDALLFEPKGDRFRRSFFRLLGTRNRIWVRADETATRRQFESRFEGRLQRFDTLPYATQVRDYYAARIHSARPIDPAALRRFLVERGPLADRSGDPVQAAETDELLLLASFPDEIEITYPKDRFATAEDAQHEVERLGAPSSPPSATSDGFSFVVRSPPGADRDALIKTLEERNLPFAARRPRFPARVDELRGDGLGISIAARPDRPLSYDLVGRSLQPRPPGEPLRMAWPQLESVQVPSPIAIPSDGWILVENERPSDFSWVLAIDAVLIVFILFNGWLLLHNRRSVPQPGQS